MPWWMQLITGGHVPLDMTSPALHLCAGPKNYASTDPKIPPMAADECTVALCVHVFVAKQRRVDLIDELQLRGSTVFLHVDTGHLSSTTTGISTSLSKQGHKVLCHGRQKACTPTLCASSPAKPAVNCHRCRRRKADNQENTPRVAT